MEIKHNGKVIKSGDVITVDDRRYKFTGETLKENGKLFLYVRKWLAESDAFTNKAIPLQADVLDCEG